MWPAVRLTPHAVLIMMSVIIRVIVLIHRRSVVVATLPVIALRRIIIMALYGVSGAVTRVVTHIATLITAVRTTG